MPYGLDMGSKALRGPKKSGFCDLGDLAHTLALEGSKKGEVQTERYGVPGTKM